MITCNINKQTVSIQWRYNNNITTCIISDDSIQGNILTISTGTATKSEKDSHCKETARKVSLTRALENSGAPHNVRKEIWTAYHNRKKNKYVVQDEQHAQSF